MCASNSAWTQGFFSRCSQEDDSQQALNALDKVQDCSLERDLFLSRKEHTHFPGILLGGDVPSLPSPTSWKGISAGRKVG